MRAAIATLAVFVCVYIYVCVDKRFLFFITIVMRSIRREQCMYAASMVVESMGRVTVTFVKYCEHISSFKNCFLVIHFLISNFFMEQNSKIIQSVPFVQIVLKTINSDNFPSFIQNLAQQSSSTNLQKIVSSLRFFLFGR